jgi:hypothetical protein
LLKNWRRSFSVGGVSPAPVKMAFSFLCADPRLEGACTPGISPTRLNQEIYGF